MTPPGLRQDAARWRVVGAAFAVALFGWGLGFYAHGLYLVEVRRATGWSTSFVAGVVTAHYLASSLMLPHVSAAMDRFGPRRVIFAGLGALALAVLALPEVRERWQLIAIYALFAFAWSCTSSVMIATLVGRWFERRRGLALNLALGGATAAGLVVAPAFLTMAAARGFAEAGGWMIVAMVALAGLAVAAFVRWPEERERAGDRIARASAPDETLSSSAEALPSRRELLGDRDFLSISAAFACALLVQAAFLTQQVAILQPVMAEAWIGLTVMLTAGSALAGRLLMAWVIDRVDQRRASMVGFLSQAAALAAMAISDSPAVWLAACVVFGFTVGNLITLAALIIQREFPAGVYGTAVGLNTAIGQVVYAFGPVIFGGLRDLFDSYRAALVFGVIGYVVAAAIIVRRARGGRPPG